jgi:hypothetical protein
LLEVVFAVRCRRATKLICAQIFQPAHTEKKQNVYSYPNSLVGFPRFARFPGGLRGGPSGGFAQQLPCRGGRRRWREDLRTHPVPERRAMERRYMLLPSERRGGRRRSDLHTHSLSKRCALERRYMLLPSERGGGRRRSDLRSHSLSKRCALGCRYMLLRSERWDGRRRPDLRTAALSERYRLGRRRLCVSVASS